jgi:3-hydroxyisobutyrate dehydrogenase-like beta-hydroxyacid dehydrogenase
MERVGFIGLGTMGFPMASNLLKAGYQVSAYNRTAAKAEKLAAMGATIRTSPAGVAAESEIVLTMLTADEAVEEVILGAQGVSAGIAPGKIVVDCSTIAPATSQKIGRQLAKAGVEMLDAPVTGSEPQALEGILTFMVGGKKETFERCLPLFLVMGKKAYYM